MTWLGTSTGKRIDLLNPDPTQFTLEDIALALSRVPRFGGHTNDTWTVLQHSMAVAGLVKPELKAQALLHDATEAYICDIPSPLKALLGESYKAVERRIAGAISKSFGVDLVNLDIAVKRADAIMLMTERDHFQRDGLPWEKDYSAGLRCEHDYWKPNSPQTFISLVRHALTFTQ